MLAKPQPYRSRDLRAQPVHVVVVAFDGDDVRPVDRGAEHLGRLEVVAG